jgi:hypothetical protein
MLLAYSAEGHGRGMPGFLSLLLYDLICGEGFFAYQRKKPQE